MIINGTKRHRIFNIEDKGKVTRASIGDSYKTAEGFKNFFWQGAFFGQAKALVDTLNHGDDIVIIEGNAYVEEYNGKMYPKVSVFKAEVYQGDNAPYNPPVQNQQPYPNYATNENPPEIPYEPVDDQPF